MVYHRLFGLAKQSRNALKLSLLHKEFIYLGVRIVLDVLEINFNLDSIES